METYTKKHSARNRHPVGRFHKGRSDEFKVDKLLFNRVLFKGEGIGVCCCSMLCGIIKSFRERGKLINAGVLSLKE